MTAVPATARGGTVEDLIALADSGRRFRTVYADPPWSFQTWSGRGKGRSAENHYRTSPLDDIKTLPVARLAAENCALLLWTTAPFLPAALDVITAWGFEYRTMGFVWVKTVRAGWSA